MSHSSRVSIIKSESDYVHSSEVFAAVRNALEKLELEPDFIQPGNKVVLKPNWVKEHDERHPGPGHWEHVVTHLLVIEGFVAWAGERLRGDGAGCSLRCPSKRFILCQT